MNELQKYMEDLGFITHKYTSGSLKGDYKFTRNKDQVINVLIVKPEPPYIRISMYSTGLTEVTVFAENEDEAMHYIDENIFIGYTKD